MIRIDVTPEDLSLAVNSLRNVATRSLCLAYELSQKGDRTAPVHEAKAAKLKAAADRLESALP